MLPPAVKVGGLVVCQDVSFSRLRYQEVALPVSMNNPAGHHGPYKYRGFVQPVSLRNKRRRHTSINQRFCELEVRLSRHGSYVLEIFPVG